MLEAPLPSLDDPIGDYIDGTNFNQLPLWSITIDGSRLPPGTPIFDVEGSNTGIYGWRLAGATGDAIRVAPSTLLPRMHGLLFQGNLIEDARGAGIAIRTGPRSGISWDVQVLENAILRCAGGGLRFEAGAGALQDARLIVERNLLEGNGVPAPGAVPGHGIGLIGATSGNDFFGDFEIRENFLRANAGCGVLVDGAGPGTTWGGIIEGNSSQANGYGIALYGASLPGAGQNDVSASLRRHRAWRDVHASVLAVGGAASGTSGAFVALSLRDVRIVSGCDVSQVLVGAGSGDAHGVSLSLREVALEQASGDGLRLEATAADSVQGGTVDVRATALEIRGATREGIAVLGGAGRGARARLEVQAGVIESCRRALLLAGSDGSSLLRDHDVEVRCEDVRFARSAQRGVELEGRGGRLALRLRACGIEASVGEGLRASDPAAATQLELDLGGASAWGLNAFLDNGLAAIALGAGAGGASARGNWWGRSTGAALPGMPNGVDPGVDAGAPLSGPTRLRLEQAQLGTLLGTSIALDLPDAMSLSVLFAGAQALDLSAQGRGVWLDPFDPSTAWLAALPGGGGVAIPVPADPALRGARVIFQAFAPAEGLSSSVRVHWLQ